MWARAWVRTTTAVAFGLLLLVIGVSGVTAQPEYATVELSYTAGSPCSIAVAPDPVEIFWDKAPRRVEWVAADGAGHYWTIDWKAADSDHPGRRDHFGQNFRIRCGESTVRSTVPGNRKQGSSWPYNVAVYACDDNHQGDLLCSVDPQVDWGD